MFKKNEIESLQQMQDQKNQFEKELTLEELESNLIKVFYI